MPKLDPDLPPMTDADEARAQAGIASDADNPEWTETDFQHARPFGKALPALARAVRRARGAQKAPKKVPVTIRLSPQVLEAFRATGPGWQGRMNAELEKAARKLSNAT